MIKFYMPWKVKKGLEKLIGEDYIHNRSSFKPDFSFKAIQRKFYSQII